MSDNRPFAVVTGGSRGIGRAIVLAFAEKGYNVMFCHRKATPDIENITKLGSSYGVEVVAKCADVTSYSAMSDFFLEAESRFGPVNVLITCAGITSDVPLYAMDASAWDQVIDVNLNGTFNICRTSVFGMMKRKAGSIINISSVSGVSGNEGQTNYSASKGGIIAFSKALSKEVGPFGVRVNVVAPGFIETEMTSGLGDKALSRARDKISLRRLGMATEVAKTVVFLASEDASYITGSVIMVDGGLSL